MFGRRIIPRDELDYQTRLKLACARCLGIHHSRIEWAEELKGEGEGAPVIGFRITLRYMVLPDGKTFVEQWCPKDVDEDMLNEKKD